MQHIVNLENRNYQGGSISKLNNLPFGQVDCRNVVMIHNYNDIVRKQRYHLLIFVKVVEFFICAQLSKQLSVV